MNNFSIKDSFSLFILSLFLVLINGCETFEYHPYDTKYFDDKDVNKKNIEKIEQKENSNDTLRFVFMGDTQRFYDATNDFVKSVNQRNDIDFVIHGGDISDFGMSKEYMWIYDIMKKLKVPFVTIIGNHDALGSGKSVYKKVFGDYNMSFKTHKTKFILLNTNSLEFDHSVHVPDFDFMNEQLGDTVGINQTIVAMHAPPYDDQFERNSDILMFKYMLSQYKNVRFCIHAHCHHLMTNDFLKNNIIFYGSDDIDDRNYLLFTVTKDSYNCSVVHF